MANKKQPNNESLNLHKTKSLPKTSPHDLILEINLQKDRCSKLCWLYHGQVTFTEGVFS